jgi:hypothetical protein
MSIMTNCSVFLATLTVLTYRMLFHSERQCTFFSLVFCVLCAWSSEQLILSVFEGTGNAGHVLGGWKSSVRSSIVLLATWIKPLCMYGGLSDYSRHKCADFIDFMQGNGTCSEGA